MFVQADAINEMLAYAMEAPKQWVPKKFMDERSKPEHAGTKFLLIDVFGFAPLLHELLRHPMFGCFYSMG